MFSMSRRSKATYTSLILQKVQNSKKIKEEFTYAIGLSKLIYNFYFLALLNEILLIYFQL